MRGIIWVALLVLFAVSSVQAYSQQPDLANTIICDTVTVESGDTVWKIAARYQAPQEDLRDVVMAIRAVNGLNANCQIQVGQDLKIPAKAK
jgi:nucleoid-associated protein YgaU